MSQTSRPVSRGSRPGEPVAGVLLSNDQNVVALARLRGVRFRTTRQILDHAVTERRLGLTAAAADNLFAHVRQVFEVTSSLR